MLKYAYYQLPIGLVELSYRDDILVSLQVVDKLKHKHETNEFSELVYQELLAYFNGKLKAFSFNYQLSGSEFEVLVYQALLTIPYGEVRTYQDIAEIINKPKAYRAVGNALNKNKLLLIIPCHRIKAKNSLGGYVLGSEIKTYLLTLEGVVSLND